MARRIYKYLLFIKDGPQPVAMPLGAVVRHVGVQFEAVCLWADVDSSEDEEIRRFVIAGTGHDLLPDWDYVGTVQMPPYVWHVFEV